MLVDFQRLRVFKSLVHAIVCVKSGAAHATPDPQAIIDSTAIAVINGVFSP